MHNKQYWQDIANQIQQLQKQIDLLHKDLHTLAKQKHILQNKLNQHKKQQAKPKQDNWQKSIAFEMFGKRLKDLTPTEYKVYFNARQRINRAKAKTKKDGNKNV